MKTVLSGYMRIYLSLQAGGRAIIIFGCQVAWQGNPRNRSKVDDVTRREALAVRQNNQSNPHTGYNDWLNNILSKCCFCLFFEAQPGALFE